MLSIKKTKKKTNHTAQKDSEDKVVDFNVN